jgi:capsular exopolysaccharide synthesis family protein
MALNRTTFRDYIRIIFRHKFVVIVTFLTVMITVYVGLKLQTSVYEAQTKILISGAKETGAIYYSKMKVDDEEIANTQSAIVTSGPVLGNVVRALKLDQQPLDYEKRFASPIRQWFIDRETKKLQAKIDRFSPEQRQNYLFQRAIEVLRSKIEVELLRRTSLIAIHVQDFDPKQTAILANMIGRSYAIFDMEQQLAELQLKYGAKHPIIRQIQDNINEMKINLTGEPLNEIQAIGPASVKIIEQAFPPLRPIENFKYLKMMLAFFLAVFLAIVLPVVLEYLDQTIKTPKEAERILKIPPLGSIPRKRIWERAVFKNLRSKSLYSKSYQNLIDHIRLITKEKEIKVLLFTSSEKSEGTTRVLANTGFLLANNFHKSVLMIDANLRKPALHTCFNQVPRPGLTELIEKERNFNEVIRNVTHDLQLIPAGRLGVSPTLILDSKRMEELLKEFKDKYDFILIDAPNLKEYKDAMALSAYVDGVVMVLSEQKSSRHTIQSVIHSSNHHIAPKLLGFVFNKRSFVIPKFIYERV